MKKLFLIVTTGLVGGAALALSVSFSDTPQLSTSKSAQAAASEVVMLDEVVVEGSRLAPLR